MRMKDDLATYGGAGWTPREQCHREDVEAGILWHNCGTCSETNTLLEVLLVRPTREMFPQTVPDDFLFVDWPKIEILEQQSTAIANFYQAQGVTVHWVKSNPALLPNFIYQRDLFLMTPEGAVLSRPASAQRAAEARFTAMALSELAIPILATPRRDEVFEAADVLWLANDCVMIGVGLRTNQAAATFLTRLLREVGIDAVRVNLPSGIQHLLGIVNLVDHDLAVVRSDKATADLLDILRNAHIETIPCDPDEEIVDRLGMNFVAIGPRRIVMPGGCPNLRRRLMNSGISVHEIDISEYLKGAGGLGCLTGIIRRQM